MPRIVRTDLEASVTVAYAAARCQADALAQRDFAPSTRTFNACEPVYSGCLYPEERLSEVGDSEDASLASGKTPGALWACRSFMDTTREPSPAHDETRGAGGTTRGPHRLVSLLLLVPDAQRARQMPGPLCSSARRAHHIVTLPTSSPTCQASRRRPERLPFPVARRRSPRS